MRQYEAAIQAMEQLGGYSTLGQLYTVALKLPAPLLADNKTKAKSKEVQLFDHTYYQGLLVQLGNLQNFMTYVPPQDKNRLYLGKEKLASMASREKWP